MNTLSLKVRYRPVRIGWCIRANDMLGFRNAVRQNFTMWGGYFNPIIPIDNVDLALALVRAFRVDVLWPATDDAAIKQFIATAFPFLPNPMFSETMFVPGGAGQAAPVLLDIYHPIQKLYDQEFRTNLPPRICVSIYQWDERDPLADLFLCTRGGIPELPVTGMDYIGMLRRKLSANVQAIALGGEVPPDARNEIQLAALSALYMRRHYSIRKDRDNSGVYVGSADNFDDLLTFWNLRATEALLFFYDPRYAERQGAALANYLQLFQARPRNPRQEGGPAVWFRDVSPGPDVDSLGQGAYPVPISPILWSSEELRASYMYFSEGSTLGAIGPTALAERQVDFQLPPMPFDEDSDTFRQHLVASIDVGIGLFGDERATLMTPYIPELNEYYGRNCYYDYDAARVEPEGLGIILDASRTNLSLRAMDVSELLARILQLRGVVAEPSKPGLIATRLIQQMGGLSGCRAFKVGGVRSLIESYRPDQSFTRSHAIQTIRAEGTNYPITLYQRLHIEPSTVGSDAHAVFDHLLRHNIFRPGLRFDCPNCRLEFWVSLDDVRTKTTCEYCGHEFGVTPHLRDRDWAFRRSGLFGRSDHQEGAIPVVLTLQQMNTVLHSNDFIYTTAMTLKSEAGAFHDCETDFIALTQRSMSGSIEIAIGECKTRADITADDVQKLMAAANTIESERIKVFVVFSKLGTFSSDEIQRMRPLNHQHPYRLILLTPRELEPYRVYEQAKTELGINDIVLDLDSMAALSPLPKRLLAGFRSYWPDLIFAGGRF